MRPQATKSSKRPSHKGPVKTLIKKKSKAELEKKRKIIIKKLAANKQKVAPTKCLAKGASLKIVKSPNKAAVKPKIAISKQSPSKHQSPERAHQKKKVPANSPEKSKTTKKKIINSPPPKGQLANKMIKIAATKNVSAARNKKAVHNKQESKEVKTLKKCKAPATKDKAAEGSPKNNAKNSGKDPAKAAVKKSADCGQSVTQNKMEKEKDRSRSLEKKRVGVTRSSSAPLIPSQESIDSAVKDAKPLVVTRTNKASLENIAVQSGQPPTKAPVNKKVLVPNVTQIKSKESDAKSPQKSNLEKTEVEFKVRTLWAEDAKTVDLKSQEIDAKIQFTSEETILSPLGRKKLVGKVKPIARVKGTIIEKRVELEKRKLTNSPAKIVDDKPISEKDTPPMDKFKTDSDNKKDSDESKKVSNEKLPPKQLKSPKRDVEKGAPIPADKNVMIVQPEVVPVTVNIMSKSDSVISKSPQKPRVVKASNIRKMVKVSNVKLVTKTAKAKLKHNRAIGNKKILVIRKNPVIKKVVKITKKVSDTDDSSKDTEDATKQTKNSNSMKNVSVKITDSTKFKFKDNVPKKIKIEPKDSEEAKKKLNADSVEIKKELISQTKTPCSNDSKEVTPVDKTKSKLSKNDRSPSPKVNKGKQDESSVKVDSIKKEKSTTEKSKSAERKSPKSSDSDKKKSTPKQKLKVSKKSGKSVKKFITIPTQENIRRKKLMGFWTGPKRHREASLNALAKVQCLYENESRTHLELGLMKTIDKMPFRSREFVKKRPIKVEKSDSASSESEYETRIKPEINSSEEDSNPPVMRTLRCQPGSRGGGKYWEKISSSEDSEAELKKLITSEKKKITKPKVVVKRESTPKPEPKNESPKEKKPQVSPLVKKRRKRSEVVMDLKDMVVKKRMASLNASAILAASYEKRSPRSGRDETTSSDSGSSEMDEILTKKSKFVLPDKADSAKKDFPPNADGKSATKAKVEVIVNQEADVTITGVYSTHHEAYCTVSGLQYRISATSHTQTTATASTDKELPSGGSGPSYTPLGALSSMHPPGGTGAPHPHQGALIQGGPLVGSLGRRAGCSSAFSAPHHHSDADRSIPPGYYQPAGPLITATPLHGGFKDGGAPPSLQAEQASQFGRYPYPQPQQVVHYGAGFGGQYAPHSHYGAGEMCYGAGRAPGSGPVPPPPSCYRPPAAHRTASVYRHSGAPGSGPLPPTGSHDNPLSPAAPEAYAPSYCPPCYQHPHAASRASIAYIDPAYQGPCPCPMQSCPKNVHTGPVTGNPPAGGGPILSSPPGGSRAPAPIQSVINYCVDDKRKGKISNGKDPPLLNQVLKNECNLKNGSDPRNSLCQMRDPGDLMNGRSPKLEYFPEQVSSRSQQAENRGGCCAVAINPSLSVIPPEPHGPPSPARGSAGASIPQPPDPPHSFLNQQPSPLLGHNLSSHGHPVRRARVGKAMVRKSIGAEEHPGPMTMLLMCQPPTVPAEVIPPIHVSAPLQVITETIDPKIDGLKSEIDSGDDVILLDSPSSKMAPIDLSSSEENGNDSKSEKDCTIVRSVGSVIDLSVETKKENSSSNECSVRKNGSLVSDAQALKEHNIDKNYLNSNQMKKCSDIKSKVSTKRRCSQPKLEIDLDVQIDDSLAANGIGEHVKLQKRQKVSINNQTPVKKSPSGSYKDLIKKPEKVFKLNNGKRQLNTIKTEKCKQPSKEITIIDCEKQKKTTNKRKSTSPPASEVPIVCKRKKAASLLKTYAEKKKMNSQYEDIVVKPVDNCKKNVNSLIPKNTMLDSSLKTNTTDMPAKICSKTIPDNTDIETDANSCDATKNSSKTLSNSSMKKTKQNTLNVSVVKSRTVLNINNNVVKKVNETECNQVPASKLDSKLSVDKRRRTKSKSPAPLNWKSDKNPQKDSSVKTKCQNNTTENKDTNAKTLKVDPVKNKKGPKGKIATMSKNSKKKCKLNESNENEITELLPARRLSALRWSNGWMWEGEPQRGKVFINNEGTWLSAWCYSGMRHSSAGDSIKSGDCVLLRAGTRRTEAPFVARVTKLWENPADGEMMVSLLWYYRPEHTECGRQPDNCPEEVFSSIHQDANSVACIEDKCYVLSFNEYCRYRKQVKAAEENVSCSPSIVPSLPTGEVTNERKIPVNISPDLVLFCRRIYDFRLKKIIDIKQKKKPTN